MKNEKYEILIHERKVVNGHVLHRIRALRDFPLFGVSKGDLGGWVENENNLDIYDDSWIDQEARVMDTSYVCQTAFVSGNAQVEGDVFVGGDSRINGDACVFIEENGCIRDHVYIGYNAVISTMLPLQLTGLIYIGHDAFIRTQNDIVVLGPIGSRGSYTTFYRNLNKEILVNCGCFHGTIDKFAEAVRKTHGDTEDGKDYVAAIEFAKVKLRKER